MAKFNLNQLLSGGKTEEQPVSNYKISHLSVYDLEPSEDNFYATEQIEELKLSIATFGIKQNLIVKPVGDKYRIIAGHRRHLAALSLAQEGKREFEKVPCIVETEEDELREKILLITTNSTTRQLSDWEKIKQADEMRTILEQIKKRDKIPGRLRDLVASTLDVSATQVARMESISKNLAPEFKTELQEGNVNMSTAYELSGLPAEQQQEAYGEYRSTGNVSIKDAKQRKRDTPVPKEQTHEAGMKGCPFCGSSSRMVAELGGYRISCESCFAATGLSPDIDTAYENWNRRHRV